MRSESQKMAMAKPDLASIAKTLQLQVKYVEEWIQATQKNVSFKGSDQMDSTMCEVDNINVTVNTLNRLVSQLSVRMSHFILINLIL